ncbi:MAG: hypothetical protein K9L64_06540 [Candidatus Izimaplasma sp.]|nr:hypothetical protein [Candidatus Izimaplasma bacterium]
MNKLKIYLIRQLVKLFYRIKFKLKVNFNDFNHKRKDAYFLIGNHAFLHDGLIHAMFLKKYPFPIINSFMFTNQKMKYILTKVITSIPKRKGQIDITTLREMMRIIKNNRGIMVFPEGNSSFFGKESEIPFSTVKLFKKFKIDVVVCKTNGAYLTSARWGKKATKRGLIEMNYYTLFKGDELENYTNDQVYKKMKDALAFNDFAWNRKEKHLYNPKHRALGLETYIYVCPKCLSYQSLSTKGNQIFCDNCGEIGHFNEYSLLSGLPFDNLIAWDKLQKERLPEIVKNIISSSGSMHKVDMREYTTKSIGFVDIELSSSRDNLIVINNNQEIKFELNKIQGLTLTRKKEVSFDYKGLTYLFKLEDPMLIYDAINYLKESSN